MMIVGNAAVHVFLCELVPVVISVYIISVA